MQIVVDMKWEGFPNITRAELRGLIKKQYVAIGKHWHTHFRPLHFRELGKARYGYTPRSPQYEFRKKKSKKHTRPLWWSGLSNQSSKDIKRFDATRYGVNVRMHAPALNFKPPNSNIHMIKELQSYTADEMQTLADLMVTGLATRCARFSKTTTRRIRF